jgi:hypothetical protein
VEIKDATLNRSVGLDGDPAFWGYLFGRVTTLHSADDVTYLVYIKEAGATGLSGIKPFPLADLVALDAGEKRKNGKRDSA